MPEEATQAAATQGKADPTLDTDAARELLGNIGLIEDASEPETEADATGENAASGTKRQDDADTTNDGKDPKGGEAPKYETIDDLPGLTRRQREAAKSRKWTPEKVLALGDHATDVLDSIADLRSQVSKGIAAEDFEQKKGGETAEEGEAEEAAASTAAVPDALPDDFAFTAEDVEGLEYDPEGFLAKLNQLTASNRSLAQRVAAQKQADNARRQSVESQQIDDFFEGLDERVFDVFGDGPTAELHQADPPYQKRAVLIKQARDLGRTYPDKTIEDRLDRVLRMEYADSYGRAQRARPATRKAPTPTSRPSDSKVQTEGSPKKNALDVEKATGLLQDAQLI